MNASGLRDRPPIKPPGGPSKSTYPRRALFENEHFWTSSEAKSFAYQICHEGGKQTAQSKKIADTGRLSLASESAFASHHASAVPSCANCRHLKVRRSSPKKEQNVRSIFFFSRQISSRASFFGACGTGRRGDTSPSLGCCPATRVAAQERLGDEAASNTVALRRNLGFLYGNLLDLLGPWVARCFCNFVLTDFVRRASIEHTLISTRFPKKPNIYELLDIRQPIWKSISRMPKISTNQVAKKLGIGVATLTRYIQSDKVPAPKPTMVGGMRMRLWGESDVERLRAVLPKIRNGRKTRYASHKRETKKKQ